MKKRIEIGWYAYNKECEPDLMTAILNLFKCNSDYYYIDEKECHTRDSGILSIKFLIGGIDEHRSIDALIQSIIDDIRIKCKSMKGLREGWNTIALIMCNGEVYPVNIDIKSETSLFND